MFLKHLLVLMTIVSGGVYASAPKENPVSQRHIVYRLKALDENRAYIVSIDEKHRAEHLWPGCPLLQIGDVVSIWRCLPVVMRGDLLGCAWLARYKVQTPEGEFVLNLALKEGTRLLPDIASMGLLCVVGHSYYTRGKRS